MLRKLQFWSDEATPEAHTAAGRVDSASPSSPKQPDMPATSAPDGAADAPHVSTPEESEPPLTKEAAQELAEMIIAYRLTYGRRARQSPAEILAWVAHDLHQSGAEQALSHESVAAAVQSLVRRRSGPRPV